MRFINVTADQCNAQGSTAGIRAPRVEFHLNSDLIGGIRNTDILLKGGKILNLNDNYFINIRLGSGIKLADI